LSLQRTASTVNFGLSEVELARRPVGYLHLEWRKEDNYGFLAFYDRCYFSVVRYLLDDNGFENIRFNLLYYRVFISTFSLPLSSDVGV
jgi:hypothetical protein